MLTRRIHRIILLLALLIGAAGMNYVQAQTSGSCGTNVTWTLSDGVLTISGTGEMASWSAPSHVPWSSRKNGIRKVVVESGVTSIGNLAFYECGYLTSAQLPSGLTTIRFGAFYHTGLTSITIPNSVTTLGSAIFQGCYDLTNIYVSWTENIPAWTEYFTTKLPQSSIKLHVPCGTKSLYQAANGWKNYTLTETTIGGNCGANGDNLTWLLSCDGVLTISGSGAMADYTAASQQPWASLRDNITSIVVGSGITHIGAFAFHSLSNLSSITIPSSVTSIGNYAFRYCYALTSITLPNALTSIGTGAFRNCTGLTSITIPSSVTAMGTYVLTGTTNLKDIYLKWTGTNILSLPDNFSATDKTVHIPCGTLSDYTDKGWSVYTLAEEINGGTCGYPGNENNVTWSLSCDSVLTISGTGAMAHYNSNTMPWYAYRKAIKSVVIGGGVTNIGQNAFYACSSLTSVTLPSDFTSISDYAFYGCGSLTSITIPSSTNHLGWDAFMNTGLTDVFVYWTTSSAIPYWNDLANTSTITLHVPCGTQSVYKSKNGWKDCNIVEEIASGTCGAQGDNLTWSLSCDGVLTITGTGAMAGWENIADIPWYSYQESITSVIIEEGVTNIGRGAFYRISSLVSATIPSSVTSIDYCAFYECTSLVSVTIQEGLISFGVSAFNGCSALTSAPITNSVTSIGNSAFKNCSSLSSLAIPNGVETIGNSAFESCSGLTSVTIPNNVTRINEMAFRYCSSLTEVTIPGSVTRLSSFAFANCSALTSVVISEGVEIIDMAAFQRCSHLTTVTFPSSVTGIYVHSFTFCSAITDIYVSWTENIPYWNNITNRSPQSDITLHIPCGTEELYNAADGWKDYTIEGEGTNTVTVMTDDSSMGLVQIGTAAEQASFTEQFNCGEEITITAIPANGYAFDQWSDNSYQASRTITLTSDTTLKAIFRSTVYPTEHGALPGVFSVSDTKKVVFSQGNLQFNAALGTHQCSDRTTQTGTWRFAENQYDFVGDNTQGNVYFNDEKCSNERVSNSYNGWIDYFNHGNTGYNKSPTSYTTAYGMNFNSPSVYDWGSYVAISNGGNMPGYYIVNGWIVLQRFQWNYLFNSRANAQDLRSLATVNDVLGCILLPDDWQLPSGIVFTPDESSYATNTYTREQWNRMEQAGAVFLPAAGRRAYDSNGSPQLSYPEIQTTGYVWSSSGIGNQGAAVAMSFGIDNFALKSFYQGTNYDGVSVRLVHYVSSYHIIFRGYKDGEENVVLQDKLVAEGAMPIPPEVPEDDCRTFIGWDRVIEPASGDTEYIAQYELKGPYTITVQAEDPTMGNVRFIED